MRVLKRYLLAAVVSSAALLSVIIPAACLAAAPTGSAVPLASCPSGTNWDSVTSACH